MRKTYLLVVTEVQWRFIDVSAKLTSSSFCPVGDQLKPKMLSSPRKPTTAFTGSNVTLEWRYSIPSSYSVDEISFGEWGPPGYIRRKLINVKPGKEPEIRPGFEEKVGWRGNFSTARAAFVLRYVSKQDEQSYGIHIELGLQHNPLTDSVNLQVQGT